MDALFTLVAVALPVLAGGLLLNLFVPNTPARAALVWGNGALIGLLLLPVVMRIFDALGYGLTFTKPAIVMASAIVLALLAYILRTRKDRDEHTFVADPPMKGGQRLLFLLLFGLVLLRLATLGLEVMWRPLFPWDATMHWATKARVWFEFGTMVPFVDNEEWLRTGGEGVFTDRHPAYPPTIPLLQVWMNLAYKHWDESLMNLPWPICLAALASAFYGHLRLAGCSAVTAITGTYLLTSMPLINIHVALAGYADLFLGAAYCCAIMALHNWSVSRQNWLLVMALLFQAACPLIKNEGLIWALTLLPAIAIIIAMRVISRRVTATILACLAMFVVFALLVSPGDLVIAGHELNEFVPRFNLEGLVGVVTSIWLHDNWHLAGYLLLVILPIGVVMPRAMLHDYAGVSAALGSALCLFLFLFLFTGFSRGAANLTGVARLSIHLIPGLMFLCVLIFDDLCRRGRILAPPAPQRRSSN